MKQEVMRQEISEALAAGERALKSLYTAQDRLNSAKNWGIFDMLGGGFFTDLIKHAKMNEASSLMEAAKYDLQAFQRELRDVQMNLDLKMELGGFLSFADFFFDGLVTDYLVQSRISDARAQVSDAISRVEYLVGELKRQRGYY